VGKKKVTIEDLMEVISELFSEIQASQRNYLRLSLARKSKSGNPSLTFLPLLWKIFHSVPATGQITIIPIRNDGNAGPLQLSSQINVLTAIGSKTFLKASQPNGGSIVGDFHISTSLLFEELCQHPKISEWMTLYGYPLTWSR